MKVVATIADADFAAQALTALDSARRHNPHEADYLLLLATSEPVGELPYPAMNVAPLMADRLSERIYYKYQGDSLRWSLKPCLLKYLLGRYEQAVYLDSDLWFVSDWSKLWQFDGMLLTPHFRAGGNSFLYKHGYFNAGFIGADRSSLPALEWWQERCFEACTVDFDEGLFTDQKYLDVLALQFGATICRDESCNVAGWREGCPDHVTFWHMTPRGKAEWMPFDEYQQAVDEWQIEPPYQRQYMICNKVAGGWIGPLGNRAFNKAEAARALELYEAGELGMGGEYKLVALT